MQAKGYFIILILSSVLTGETFVKAAAIDGCPPDKPRVNCFADPCSKQTCLADPTATCFSNYCGGCNAVWLTSKNQPAQCYKKTKCPPGQKEVQCIKDPCQGATCPADPTATCFSNYCGGCNAVWLTPKNKPAQCYEKTECPPGQDTVECFRDPCQGETCPAYPDAECHSNYCGGCNAVWYTSNSDSVQCDITS